MKKLRIFVMFIALLICVGCFSAKAEAAGENESISIELSSKKVYLAKGTTSQLKATVTGTSRRVRWSSNKNSVATVSSNGKIKAKKAGTAVITARVGGIRKSCKVRVINLRAPKLHAWKKTLDSSEPGFPYSGEGVTYTVKWDKVSGADGYQVYYMSKEPLNSWNKTKTFTKKRNYSESFSFIDMKLRVKVRAYKIVQGKKIYSKWSNVQSKTISY